MASRCWPIFLVVGLAAALSPLWIGNTAWSYPLYFSVALFAVGGGFVGIRLNHPHHTGPWLMLALAQAVMVAGGIAQVAAQRQGYFATHLTFADGLYAVAYVVFFLGLLGLVRGREGVPPQSGLLDSLVVVTGLALICWQFLVLPTSLASFDSNWAQLLRTLYPIFDLLLIGMLVWLLTAPEVRSASYRFLLAGMLVWAFADAVFHLTSMSSGEPQDWMKSAWLVAYVLWGAAALHPSMHRLQAPRHAEHPDVSHTRMALLLAAALCIPGVIAVEAIRGGSVDPVGLVCAGVIIIVLIWMRIRRLLARLYLQSQRLSVLAQTDFLTGLPNRRRLVRIANQWLGNQPGMTALLAIDIDRFKGVNDTFGHHVGDDLICALVRRWQSGMEPGDVLARTGGDEFVLLIGDIGSRASAVKRAWRLQAMLAEPLELDGLRLNASASIGVAVSPVDGTDLESLLKRADWAMRAAKKRQSRVELHSRRLKEDDSWRLLLLNEFREAIKRKELVLQYQPKVHLGSGRVIGVEALVRWNHPEHGMLKPASFLPTIEQTELITDLTQYVLDQAVAQGLEWRRQGLALGVAINLSARNIPDMNLVESVRVCLKKYGLPPQVLGLEITESSAMADPVHGVKTLHALEKLGVTLSVDDYGMGNGSLDYLRKLPVKLLKLDSSFIKRMTVSDVDAAIVRSTLELARHLRMDVVAEGVENAATLAMLKQLDCFAAQGYFLSPPVAADRMGDVIADIEARMAAIAAKDRTGARLSLGADS